MASRTTERKPRPTLTYDRLRSDKKPIERPLRFVKDDTLGEDLEQAREALTKTRDEAVADAIRRRRAEGTLATATSIDVEKDPRILAAKDQVEAAERAVREGTLELRFRSLGRKRYEALIADNPPTPEQTAKAKEEDNGNEPAWNPDTFPAKLVAATLCNFEPRLTEEQAAEMLDGDDFNQAEAGEIVMTAIMVNTQRRVSDLGNGYGLTSV